MENEYSKEFCHLCLDEFEDSDNNDGAIVECCACGRMYHKACWDENGGCVCGGADHNEKKKPIIKESSEDDSVDCDAILYKTEDCLKKLGTAFVWIAVIWLFTGFIFCGVEPFFIAIGAIAFVVWLIIGLFLIFFSCSVTIMSKKIIVSSRLSKKSIYTYAITDVYCRTFIPVIVISTSGCKTKLYMIKNGNEFYEMISSLLDERNS